MAKGSSSKIKITEKILETFEGAFICNDGKEIRIPMIEDGAEVQIKVTLTAAKVNVERDTAAAPSLNTNTHYEQKDFLITKEEKQEVLDIINKLNL